MISKHFRIMSKRFSEEIQHKSLAQLMELKKIQNDEKSFNIKYNTLNNMTTIMSTLFGLILLRNGYIITSLFVASVTMYRHFKSGTKIEKTLKLFDEKFTDKNLKEVSYVLE